jgi:hypothetical protein
MAEICCIPGCDREVFARGMCARCYQRFWRALNRDKVNEYAKKYYNERRKKETERSRKYRYKNPE